MLDEVNTLVTRRPPPPFLSIDWLVEQTPRTMIGRTQQPKIVSNLCHGQMLISSSPPLLLLLLCGPSDTADFQRLGLGLQLRTLIDNIRFSAKGRDGSRPGVCMHVSPIASPLSIVSLRICTHVYEVVVLPTWDTMALCNCHIRDGSVTTLSHCCRGVAGVTSPTKHLGDRQMGTGATPPPSTLQYPAPPAPLRGGEWKYRVRTEALGSRAQRSRSYDRHRVKLKTGIKKERLHKRRKLRGW